MRARDAHSCLLATVLLAALPAGAAAPAPGTPPSLEIGRAAIRAYDGDYEGALQAYEAARKAGACEEYNCHQGLAEAYRHLGRADEALREARASVEFQEKTGRPASGAYNELGVALVLAGEADAARLQEAESALRKALASYEGNNDDFRYNLAVVLRKLGKTEESQALFDELHRGPGPGPVFSQNASVVGRFVPYKVVSHPPPDFPRQARKSGTEGKVSLEGIVDTKGRVRDLKITQDVPQGVGEAVRNAVRNWKFSPATLDGEPVASHYFVSVQMSMKGR